MSVDVHGALEVEVRDTFAPLVHFLDVVAAAAETVRRVVLQPEIRQCAEHDLPCGIFHNKVFPGAVVNRNLDVLALRVVDQLAEVVDRDRAVFFKGLAFHCVAAGVEDRAAERGRRIDQVLVVLESGFDDVSVFIDPALSPASDGTDDNVVLFHPFGSASVLPTPPSSGWR